MPLYRVSTENLATIVNPMSGEMWKCEPIDVEEVKTAMSSGCTAEDSWNAQKDAIPNELHRDFHVRRIAALASKAISNENHPVVIAIAPDRVWIYDGNHRVAAAIVRGDPTLDVIIAPYDASAISSHFPTAELLDEQLASEK
mgnify:CR=1 FL=1